MIHSQRALLRAAVEGDYFKVPRETTLVELAERHDTSDREVGELLRAGIDTVLRETVLDDEPESR